MNFESNNSEGEIVSAVFLYMKWYSVRAADAKAMLRAEIILREKAYGELKAQFLALPGRSLERIKYWFELLDLITAGNFA